MQGCPGGNCPVVVPATMEGVPAAAPVTTEPAEVKDMPAPAEGAKEANAEGGKVEEAAKAVAQ